MKGIPNTKYIRKKNANSYEIYRNVPGSTKYYGRGRTLIEALMKRDMIIANGWKPMYLPNTTGERYIYPNGEQFIIIKYINGKGMSYGTFDTLEEAVKERDLLIKYNWDLELVCEFADKNEEWLSGVNRRSGVI